MEKGKTWKSSRRDLWFVRQRTWACSWVRYFRFDAISECWFQCKTEEWNCIDCAPAPENIGVVIQCVKTRRSLLIRCRMAPRKMRWYRMEFPWEYAPKFKRWVLYKVRSKFGDAALLWTYQTWSAMQNKHAREWMTHPILSFTSGRRSAGERIKWLQDGWQTCTYCLFIATTTIANEPQLIKFPSGCWFHLKCREELPGWSWV